MHRVAERLTPRGAVHEGSPLLPVHARDLVGHGIKLQPSGGVGPVSQRHFNMLELRPVEIAFKTHVMP